uniref:Uncharacterized protein n=1 Tax=Thermofilum pendens TaxID=2269 RepID=A0A7C3WLU1_THEPE
MEFCSNLLGGQPFSMKNFREVREVCDRYGLPLVSDISMLDRQVALMRLNAVAASSRRGALSCGRG